jgi:ubiquitin-protein ligase E3 A
VRKQKVFASYYMFLHIILLVLSFLFFFILIFYLCFFYDFFSPFIPNSMFLFQSETRTYWFNPSSLEVDVDEFSLIGIVIGLAIYNSVLLDLPLPLALYKKLMGQPVGLADLEEMQPTLGRSLRQLLAYDGRDGSVEDVFCLSFTVDQHVFGETRTVPLKPGGEDIPVTEANRAEYVQLYADYVLNRSIARPFEAFRRGFLTLCGGPVFQLVHPMELERLVCGDPHLDFRELRKGVKYEGGYSADSQIVKWLFEVLDDFDLEERKKFLKFFSGSDRAPVGGLGSLKWTVQRAGGDSERLPSASTCFNILLLPQYGSRAKLRHHLALAINNAEGFGLQ